MAREIRVTQTSMDALKAAFLACLEKTKLADGKVKFDYEFGTIDKKCTIRFTESAWEKMWTLVHNFDSEIGWDGVVKRGEGDTYIISDILVCPQQVTGATVNTDKAEYAAWLGNFVEDDEVFPHLRFQGHSHVNMGVTPSGTDTGGWNELLSQIGDDDFYLFMILNKRGEKTIRLYDYAKNVVYDTADCTVEVADGEHGLAAFLADAKSKVKPKTYTPANGYGYNGNTWDSYGGYQSTVPPATTAQTPKPAPQPAKQTAAAEPPKTKPAPKKGKWKRKVTGYNAGLMVL